MTELTVRYAFGNGHLPAGREIQVAIAARLREAREKHPVFAEGKYEALGVIGKEFKEFRTAVERESDERAYDEALDVIATCIRFLQGEHVCPPSDPS